MEAKAVAGIIVVTLLVLVFGITITIGLVTLGAATVAVAPNAGKMIGSLGDMIGPGHFMQKP